MPILRLLTYVISHHRNNYISMIDKRLNTFRKIVFKMSRSVVPLNVSPFIKAVRWTFLISGIFYGANRLHSLRAYEEKAGPQRRHELHVQHEKLKAENILRSMDELTSVGKDLGITEYPPGWEKEL